MPKAAYKSDLSPYSGVRLFTTDELLESRVREACDAAGLKFTGLVTPHSLSDGSDESSSDVVVIGIRGPAGQAMTIVEDVHRIFPGDSMLLVIEEPAPERLAELLRLGACGWMPTDSSADEIGRALAAIVRGEFWLSRRLTRNVFEAMTTEHRDLLMGTLSDSSDLTPREYEVAERAARGESNKKVAERLGISERTVKVHLHNAYRKLHIRHRMELLLRRGEGSKA